jgi:hypothetical protein
VHTLAENCRGSFVSLNGVFFRGCDVVSVSVCRARDNDVSVITNDTLRDKLGTNRVATDMQFRLGTHVQK